MRLTCLLTAIALSLATTAATAAETMFSSGKLDPSFCRPHHLRQTVVYIDDSILVTGDVTWAQTIFDRLKGSLAPGELTTLVELSPVTGESHEMWSGCWPDYDQAERNKLSKEHFFVTANPLDSLATQQGYFRHGFGVAAEKIEAKGGRSSVAIDPANPPQKSILRALTSDGARYSASPETLRAILYSDLAENSDLGSVFKPLPSPPIHYGQKLGIYLRRSVFYVFGAGTDIKGDPSVQDAIHAFWDPALRSMSASVGGIGTDLTVPNVVPDTAHAYDVSLVDDGQKLVGRLSLLMDSDNDLVDSWIGITRLKNASLNGTFRCIGSSTSPTCTLNATTVGNVISDSPSETLSMSSNGSPNLSGSIGIPGSAVNLPLSATPVAN